LDACDENDFKVGEKWENGFELRTFIPRCTGIKVLLSHGSVSFANEGLLFLFLSKENGSSSNLSILKRVYKLNFFINIFKKIMIKIFRLKK
jgi:hypothetical protein